jgi:hypothetical protein
MPTWAYCPNCGYALRGKVLSTSIGKQITLYLISFFLPPFGLIQGLKYFKEKDSKLRMIGVVSIILTIVAIILGILAFKMTLDFYSRLLNSFTYPPIQ